MSIDIKISTIKDCQNVQLVVQIVNEGYERGEIGMWKANTGLFKLYILNLSKNIH